MMESIINILAEYQEEAMLRLNTLANKAKKLNIGFSYYFGASFLEKRNDKKVLLTPCIINCSEESIKINGFKFIGVISRKDELHTVTEVPGYTIPVELRNSFTCSHCNVKRFRNETYVLQNLKDESYSTIGSSCIREYIGLDPSAAIASLSFYKELNEAFDDDFAGCRVVHAYDLKHFLSYTNAVINKMGWISATKAKEEGLGSCTSDDVINALEGKISITISDSDEEIAAQAINWVKSLSQEQLDNSSYLYNLKSIVESNRVIFRAASFAASIIPSYKKEQEKLQPKECSSNYLGEIKKKIEVFVTLKSHHAFDGSYGTTHLFIFKDAKGNLIKWSASSCPRISGIPLPEYNEEFLISGSVKGHEEYKGQKQTVITRAKCA